MRQLHQELVEFLLTIRKLTTSTIVHPKAVHDTIDYQQTELSCRKFLAKSIEQFQLMFAVESSSVSDILLGRFRINTETFCDL